MSSRYCAAQWSTEGEVITDCERYVGDDTTDVGTLFVAVDVNGDHQVVPLCDECRDDLGLQDLIVEGADR